MYYIQGGLTINKLLQELDNRYKGDRKAYMDLPLHIGLYDSNMAKFETVSTERFCSIKSFEGHNVPESDFKGSIRIDLSLGNNSYDIYFMKRNKKAT